MNRTRLREMLSQSRLMMLTLAAFLVSYGFIAYYMFLKGLSLVERVPGVGGFLGDRIFYLLFFFFFMMLIFSVGITNFIGLIKGREIRWLLTLPVSHRVIFLWKSTEAVFAASWGLLFISAPLLMAFAAIRDAPWDFYPKALVFLFPFVIVAATVGNVVFLAILRWVSRPVGIAIGMIFVVAAIYYGISTYQSAVDYQNSNVGTVPIDKVLQHTEISVHPLLPSTWLSHILVQWTRTLNYGTELHALALWSWALQSVVILAVMGGSWFYPGWIRNLERSAAAANYRRERSLGMAYKWVSGVPSILGLRRPVRAVIRKDVLTFIREPSQWVQFIVVYGLLLIYVLNLRNLGYDLDSPFWLAVVSYLNLTVCALAVSTLTTRFVFPQFSLEGTRLWILGMSPLGLDRVVIQKWVQAFLFTGTLAAILQVIAGYMLKLPVQDVVLFSGAVMLLSVGLCAIAVGLGALFPNLRETNAAKIVSGFGGTLCLIWSFVYIIGYIGLLFLAKSHVFNSNQARDSTTWFAISMAGVVLLTLTVGGGPLFLAMRRVKRLQFQSPLS